MCFWGGGHLLPCQLACVVRNILLILHVAAIARLLAPKRPPLHSRAYQQPFNIGVATHHCAWCGTPCTSLAVVVVVVAAFIHTYLKNVLSLSFLPSLLACMSYWLHDSSAPCVLKCIVLLRVPSIFRAIYIIYIYIYIYTPNTATSSDHACTQRGSHI